MITALRTFRTITRQWRRASCAPKDAWYAKPQLPKVSAAVNLQPFSNLRYPFEVEQTLPISVIAIVSSVNKR